MRDPEERTIDGITFTVRPLAGMKGVTFLPRLNKVLGPAIAALAASRGELDFTALKDALIALGDRLDEKELEGIIRTLLGDCTFVPQDGTPGGELMKRLDVITGQAEIMFKLLAFALEVNYSGFFPMLRELAARGAPKAGPRSNSEKPPQSGPAGA